MTIKDFHQYILKLKQSIGGPGSLNGDEGLLLGSPETEIKGVLTCWMATVDALQKAGAAGCNLVLCHEVLYFCPFFAAGGFQPQHLTWRANRRRVVAAERQGLSVFRLHGSLDLICIYDDFAEALGIKGVKRGAGWDRVFPMEETTVGELVGRVKRAFHLDRVRMTGNLDQRVRCAGLPWGGLALDSNVGYMQRCIELGADVFIAGEADEYGFTFAADAGIPLIETGHFVSESIGIVNFAGRLQRDFPGLRTVGYEDRRPFEYR
jgi:putative NIF3 family GTP cyclohydrolase 1 type 2